MTVTKYWDGSAWKVVGEPGPTGEPGVGDLLAVQREWGHNNAYVVHASGSAVYTDAAKTLPLRVSYTPTVNCWWRVSAGVDLIRKDSAEYTNMWAGLHLYPADVDGLLWAYQNEYAHSTVQTYQFRALQHTWKLVAGTPYVCQVELGLSGTYAFYQGGSQMHIQGMAYRR